VGDPATGKPIGPTGDNLKAATASETHEYTDTYPGMARATRQEGFDKIADWFETLAQAGKAHACRFKKARFDLNGSIRTMRRKLEHDRRETWTQRLTRERGSARSCTAPQMLE